MRLLERDLPSSRTSQAGSRCVQAPPVKNLVCAPPSDTPGIVYGESFIISAMNSALEPLSGPRNSTLRSPASDRSSIDLDRVLALLLGDLAERCARRTAAGSGWRLTPWMIAPAGHRRRRPGSHAAAGRPPRPPRRARWRSSGSCILRDLLLLGAGGDGTPRRRRRRRGSSAPSVNAKPARPVAALAEDRQALLLAGLSTQRSGLRWISGLRAGGGDDVVEDRPLGDLGQLLHERQVVA